MELSQSFVLPFCCLFFLNDYVCELLNTSKSGTEVVEFGWLWRRRTSIEAPPNSPSTNDRKLIEAEEETDTWFNQNQADTNLFWKVNY